MGYFPYNLYALGGVVVAFGILILFVMNMGRGDGRSRDHTRNFDISDKGTYGTAGFMTEKEFPETLSLEKPKTSTGIILGEKDGKYVCLPADTPLNKNVSVFGAPGTMKSRAFVRNAVFQAVRRGESIILTDTKSSLYEDMASYLRSNDYVVKVFNLVNLEYSDSWNCLSEIEGSDTMAQTFVDVIMKTTSGTGGEQFWKDCESNLFKALVLYVGLSYPEGSRTIGEVYRLISGNDDTTLTRLFSLLPNSHPAKAPFQIFKQANDTVRGGVIIGLGSRLQIFQNQMVRKITTFDDIQTELPGKKKCAYICMVSDQDSTFTFLSSLFFSFLFIKLVRYADKQPGGILPIPVNFILDEFCGLYLSEFEKKIATMRSRLISVACVFQNLAQLQNRYPDMVWQEILGCCDTQYFLGCTDEMTAKYISNRAGEVTVGVNSQMRTLGTWRVSNYTPEYRESSGDGRRKLLTPDEVLRLPLQQSIVIMRSQKVLIVNKLDYTKHPDAKKLRKESIVHYRPAWVDLPFHEVEAEKPKPAQKRKKPAKEKKEPEQHPVVDEETGEVIEKEVSVKKNPSPPILKIDKNSIMT